MSYLIFLEWKHSEMSQLYLSKDKVVVFPLLPSHDWVKLPPSSEEPSEEGRKAGAPPKQEKARGKKQQLCLWKIKVKAGFWIPWGSTVFQAMKMTHFKHSNAVYFKNTANKFCPVVNSRMSRFSDLCVAVKTYYNCCSTSNPLRSSRQHNHFPVQAAHNAPLLLLLMLLRLFNNTNKWKLKTKINIYNTVINLGKMYLSTSISCYLIWWRKWQKVNANQAVKKTHFSLWKT